MPRPRVGALALVAALVAAGAGLAACGESNAPVAAPPAVVATVSTGGPGGLTGFADCGALERRLRDLTLPHVTAYGLDNGTVNGRTDPRPHTPIGATATIGAPGSWGHGGPDLSASESELPTEAKTNGRLLVAMHSGTLQVVDVATDKPALLSTVAFENQYADRLLLAGDRALVLGTLHDWDDGMLGGSQPDPDEPRVGTQHTTVLTLVDLADPAHPTILGSEQILGDKAGAWFSAGVARVALTSHPYLGRNDDPPLADSAAVARNRQAAEESPAATWLPHRRILDGSGATVDEGPLVECPDVLGSASDSGVDMFSVLALDLTVAEPFSSGTSTAVIGSGALAHASPGRLFVASTAGGWGNSAVLNAAGPSTPLTIHAFEVRGRAGPDYLGSRGLNGYVRSADDLSTHGGRLRVALTTGRPWSGSATPPGKALVTILGTNRLERMGTIGLGALTVEEGWAVRWVDGFAAVQTSSAGPVRLVDLTGKGAIVGVFPHPELGLNLYPIGAKRAVRLEQVRSGPGKKHAADQIRLTTFDLGSPHAPRWVEEFDVDRGKALGDLVYLPRTRIALLLSVYRNVDARVGGVIGLRLDKAGIATRLGRWNADGPREVLEVRGLLALLTTHGMSLIDPRTMKELSSTAFRSTRTP